MRWTSVSKDDVFPISRWLSFFLSNLIHSSSSIMQCKPWLVGLLAPSSLLESTYIIYWWVMRITDADASALCNVCIALAIPLRTFPLHVHLARRWQHCAQFTTTACQTSWQRGRRSATTQPLLRLHHVPVLDHVGTRNSSLKSSSLTTIADFALKASSWSLVNTSKALPEARNWAQILRVSCMHDGKRKGGSS